MLNLVSNQKCKFVIPFNTISTWKISDKLTKSSAGEDMVQWSLFKIASGNVNQSNHFGNNWALSHKVEHSDSLWPSNYIYTHPYIKGVTYTRRLI